MSEFFKAVVQIVSAATPIALAYFAYLQFAKKSKHDETSDLIRNYQQQAADIYQKWLSSEKELDKKRNENDRLAAENNRLITENDRLHVELNKERRNQNDKD
ncbi:hypothetical protein [Schleiferilactobacillus perolens]|uniref:hypothetical protein n=1 Tax=Schleiferilactobacillus perolens TaxID=100468 RepID=UPI0039ED4311